MNKIKNIYYSLNAFLGELLSVNPRFEEGLMFVATYTGNFKFVSVYLISAILMTLCGRAIEPLQEKLDRLQKGDL